MKRICLIITAILLLTVCFLAACESKVEDNSVAESSIIESDGATIEESKQESVKAESSDEAESSLIEDSSEDKESSSVESSEPEESSTPDESSGNGENSGDSTEIEPVKVLFTRRTQGEIFVMIGTCADGAVVTAQFEGQTSSVPTHKGWFAVTLDAKGSSLKVTLSQTIDGQQYGTPAEYTVNPTYPNFKGCNAVVSTEGFQIFLDKMLPDYYGNNLYTDSVINNMKSRVSDRINQLHQYNRDAEIIYLIAPSPMTIYPELVPDRYTKGTGTTRMDQVTKALKEAGATVIDVRETFMEHKNDEMPLYYKLDSHWADYGAYLAYYDMFEHISKKFPEAKPRELSDFNWRADHYISADAMLYLDIPQDQVREYAYYRTFNNISVPGGITSVPRYRGMQLIYNDETTYERRFNTLRNELPSCVVYRDSYCAGVYDLIPERMNYTHYIGMWNYAWNKSVIASEKPDYVIYVIAEWNMNEIVYN